MLDFSTCRRSDLTLRVPRVLCLTFLLSLFFRDHRLLSSEAAWPGHYIILLVSGLGARTVVSIEHSC